MKLKRREWVLTMVKSIIAVFFKSGLFIPTILLTLCLTTKAYFKVEDEAACAGVRWFGLVNQPTFTVRTEDVKDVTVERKWVGKKRAWQFGLVMRKDGSKLNFDLVSRGHGKTIVFPENELAAARQALKDGRGCVEAYYLLGWWPILLLFFIGFLVMAVREWIHARKRR